MDVHDVLQTFQVANRMHRSHKPRPKPVLQSWLCVFQQSLRTQGVNLLQRLHPQLGCEVSKAEEKMYYGLDLAHIVSNQDRRHLPRQIASRCQELSQSTNCPELQLRQLVGCCCTCHMCGTPLCQLCSDVRLYNIPVRFYNSE